MCAHAVAILGYMGREVKFMFYYPESKVTKPVVRRVLLGLWFGGGASQLLGVPAMVVHNQ